jgi:hypothetical protein
MVRGITTDGIYLKRNESAQMLTKGTKTVELCRPLHPRSVGTYLGGGVISVNHYANVIATRVKVCSTCDVSAKPVHEEQQHRQ